MVSRRNCFVNIVAIATAVIAVAGTAGTLHAGMIVPGGIVGTGPGGSNASGFVSPTVVANNDNSASSLNSVSLAMTFTALGPIDYGFVVLSSTGTTEYLYLPVVVTNATGVTWTDFHFQLMNAPAGLDFDTPDKDPTPTSSRFTTLNHQPTTLDWSGGSVPSGTTVSFSFSIDVPNLVGGFILRDLPTVAVPEPSSVLLLCSGLAGLAVWRRYRNHRQRVH